MSNFITLPKSTRGYWNVGTGTGEGKIIEKLLGTIETISEIEGSIRSKQTLSGSFTTKTEIRGILIDKDTLGGTLDV